MNGLEFTAVVAVGAFLGGLLGSLTGLGGGVIVVPLLTLAFGVDIRYAIGASLVSVIATSSGAAAAYLREGYSNMRVGMFLEMATTVGAISGAVIAAKLPTSTIAIVFGVVLRTRKNLRPVFVSVGHRVDLASAVKLVLACRTCYRIPEPTRQADLEVARLKRASS